ncbi:uncharacterized protein LOC121736647 [Aricia agestis]|uniref:uncharacterized protein LOC121736647 n=1 Tax=Aricia agestis TaxID=91739 RepID=UPI001C2028FE|nr:uncharacterized protein LOC121736647 [Aricia agestis]
MGGRKRSRSKENDYEDLLKKIRKIEHKVRKKRRLPSTSSSESETYRNDITEDWAVEMPLQEESCEADDIEGNIDANITDTENLDLEQDILEILGEDPTSVKSFGDNLHKDIAPRWKHILLNGLSKENRSELLKTYLVPENCTYLKAPKLNLEIKAALTEMNNKKDMYSQSKQNQLGSGLAALGKALNLVLSKTADVNGLIKPLSDAAKLFCDYYFKESQSRRFAAMNTLNKQTKDVIKNTKIDDFLFGCELAEQLKSSKAISKSGIEMRSQVTTARPAARISSTPQAGPSTAARRGALNGRGAPRAAAEPRAPQTTWRQHSARDQSSKKPKNLPRYRSKRR